MKNEYILEFQDICKSFFGVKALHDISFRVRAGEVHALMGENGAGKSTLMKILSGAYSKDSGEILVNGIPANIKNTRDSENLGVAIIYQEINLIPDMSVAENIFLERQPKKGGFIHWKKLYSDAVDALKKVDSDINPKAIVSTLSIAQQQIIEIAKALSLNSQILIMDEPTSSLTEIETRKLFQVISILKEQGITIIYISHRMDEIFEICDSYTVMRDGTLVKSGQMADENIDSIIEYMVGRSLSQVFPEKNNQAGNVVLQVEHISNGGNVKDVSFDLRSGEIVGFAGLVGAGRTETFKAVFGADKNAKGVVKINGKQVSIKSPLDAIKHGIGYLPEDRKKEGLVLELSILDNVVMVNPENAIVNGFFSKKKAKEICLKFIKSLMIKTPSEKQLAKYLSGGNQQKVVLSKWLNSDPDIIILDEPTRGIDVNAKFEFYNIIIKLAQQGKAVVLISSELPEIIGLCDRVYVMYEGEVTGILSRSQLTQQQIMHYAIGGK